VFHSSGKIANRVRDDAFDTSRSGASPADFYPAGFNTDGIIARAVTGIGSTSRPLAHLITSLAHARARAHMDAALSAARAEDHQHSTLNHIAHRIGSNLSHQLLSSGTMSAFSLKS